MKAFEIDILYIIGCLSVLVAEGKLEGPIYSLSSSGKKDFRILRERGRKVSDEAIEYILVRIGCPIELVEGTILLIREYENRKVS